MCLDSLHGIVEESITQARMLVVSKMSVTALSDKYTKQVPTFLTCMRVNPMHAVDVACAIHCLAILVSSSTLFQAGPPLVSLSLYFLTMLGLIVYDLLQVCTHTDKFISSGIVPDCQEQTVCALR
jgi:hypothetical protein